MTHAQDRLYQRFGVEVTRWEVREIVLLIQQQKSICVNRASKKRSIHILRYKNRVIKVVYSTKNKSIITALPFEPDTDSLYLEQLDVHLKENVDKDIDYIYQVSLNKYCKLGIHKSYVFDPEKRLVYKLRINGEFVIVKQTLEDVHDFIKTHIKNEFDFANSIIDQISIDKIQSGV